MKVVQVFTRTAYVALFPIVILCTHPFNGSDDAILAATYTLALSIPAALVPVHLLARLSEATSGTEFGDSLCCTAWGVWVETGLCCAAGYLQWFVLVPYAVKRWRRKVLAQRP